MSHDTIFVYCSLTMVLGTVLKYSTLLCNNLYGSMFCFAISLWGVVMLLILGISCKIQAVALFEDVNIDEESDNNTFCPGPGPNGKAFSLLESNVKDGYDNAAW